MAIIPSECVQGAHVIRGGEAGADKPLHWTDQSGRPNHEDRIGLFKRGRFLDAHRTPCIACGREFCMPASECPRPGGDWFVIEPSSRME